MIFTVERLGPVKRAEIDLSKDLILLTGPNGTGKTYVAWAVYGFLRNWAEGSVRKIEDEPLQDAIGSALDHLLASQESESDLAALVRDHGQQIIEAAAVRYLSALADDFAAHKHLFEHTSLELRAAENVWMLPDDSFLIMTSTEEWMLFGRMQAGSSRLAIGFTRGQIGAVGQRIFMETGSFSDDMLPLGRLTANERAAIRAPLAHLLLASILRQQRPSIIFPAERIATTIFSQELSLKRTELVDQMLAMQSQSEKVMGDYLRSHAQRYPRPIRDSLQMAGDLERWSREQSEFADLAEYLEQHLLRGKVQVSQYGNLTFVPDQRGDVTLGMHITASVVKSLSLLVFYLRHRALEGDFVIIDEPELNLHPDNQRLIARVLARAVNRGLKIMASTHSDYLVRELNNLIMLGQDTEPVKALRQKHGYEEAELLKPSQLGVYLFRDNTAEAVPVDETGFSIATIDAEIDRLNAVSQEIYATLFEQEPA